MGQSHGKRLWSVRDGGEGTAGRLHGKKGVNWGEGSSGEREERERGRKERSQMGAQ